MNEFTKEELINLLECVRANKAYHINHMEIIYPALANKLQYLVNSYCRHEIDKTNKRCKLCGLPSSSIPCVGGYL